MILQALCLPSLLRDVNNLQETHASTPEIIDSLNMRLQPCQSFWTEHVGIVSFSLDYRISLIDTSAHFNLPRFQLCKISHPHNFYAPFYVLNIYAPVSPHPVRREFYHNLALLLHTLRPQIPFENLIISGDFNYSYLRTSTLGIATALSWRTLLEQNFFNCMQFNDLQEVPTFQRSRGPTNSIQSVIDFIYMGLDIKQGLVDTSITHLSPTWSDHAILTVTTHMGSSKLKGGLWRANPAYASQRAFKHKVSAKIEDILNNASASESPQIVWDRVKTATAQMARKYGIKHTCWRTDTLRKLEKQKNRLFAASHLRKS
ncbi:hypothetical protein BD560DRAFT_164118 [Blakeslea trispora]|nr:hypothetical protein BD560DRAFT_164118 [Blakeslea trispora]